MLKRPKITVYNVFKRYDSRGSTENVKQIEEKKKFGRSEVWGQIRKLLCLTLQTYLTILKILMCVKNTMEVYSKPARGMQEENTNLVGKQEKLVTSRVAQAKTTVAIWWLEKSDETFRHAYICPGVNRIMIGGCTTYNGDGALGTVDGTINAAKYVEILDSCLWPDIASHYPDRAHLTKNIHGSSN